MISADRLNQISYNAKLIRELSIIAGYLINDPHFSRQDAAQEISKVIELIHEKMSYEFPLSDFKTMDDRRENQCLNNLS